MKIKGKRHSLWNRHITPEGGFSLWDCVSACVQVPPCGQWFDTTYENSKICCSLWPNVSPCIHVPPYGQLFESKLKPSIHDVHCKLMCMYVPICPHVGTGWSHSHNLQYVLYTVNSCVCMCPFSPIWPMVWYTTTTTETGCSLCNHLSVCAHVPPYGQFIES